MSYPYAGPPPAPPQKPFYSKTNHILHLLMTLLTMGLWAVFVWPWVAHANARDNEYLRRQYQKQMQEYTYAYWVWQQQMQQGPVWRG